MKSKTPTSEDKAGAKIVQQTQAHNALLGVTCQDEIKIPCNFDKQQYNTKPPQGEIGAIKARVGKNQYPNASLNKIVQAVAYDGRTMGIFQCKGTSSKDFIAARQFLLDFDNDTLTQDAKKKESHLRSQYIKEGLTRVEAEKKIQSQREPQDYLPIISPEQVRSRLKEHGINIGYAFYSPSHLEKSDCRGVKLPRFKVAIITSEIITNPKTAEGIMQGLIDLFPEVDGSGKDLARLCFGSTKGVVWPL